MKKAFLVIITFVIILTISFNTSAAIYSDILITYLVGSEFGTVVSSSNITINVGQQASGQSGYVSFTLPKVISFVYNGETIYRTPIADASFGNNIIKFEHFDTEELYNGSINGAGAEYMSTSSNGDNYEISFIIPQSRWTPSNVFYKLWEIGTELTDVSGTIYVELNVETEKAPDELIFEYLTGNYNSPELSKGNEDIGGALDALNPLGTGLAQFGEELNNSLNEGMSGVKNNASIFKTPLGKVINILGLSLSPLFDDGILFFLLMISIITIVIIAVLRKAGD